MRLYLGFPAAIISSIGLVLWGLSVDGNWHWMTGQVAFFLCKLSPELDTIFMLTLWVSDALGLQMGNTILSAYIVDNYPEYANEVITFYSVIINVSLTYIN